MSEQINSGNSKYTTFNNDVPPPLLSSYEDWHKVDEEGNHLMSHTDKYEVIKYYLANISTIYRYVGEKKESND